MCAHIKNSCQRGCPVTIPLIVYDMLQLQFIFSIVDNYHEWDIEHPPTNQGDHNCPPQLKSQH